MKTSLDPCTIIPASALEPFIATGTPSAKTLKEPELMLAKWGTHFGGLPGTNIVCGIKKSPCLLTLIPLANTDLHIEKAEANTPHLWPVTALSVWLLQIPGM